MELHQRIEGVLFYKASAMKKKVLTKLFDVEVEVLDEALRTLQERLLSGGTALIIADDEVELRTRPELDELIEDMRKDELRRDIGKAGAETLAIVLYRGPVTRSMIDRIRGVNSSYILRSLLVRGLIEKIAVGKESQFQATADLYAHLGVTSREALPEYRTVMNSLEAFENRQQEADLV